MPVSSEISKRVNSNQFYRQQIPVNQVIYYPTTNSKPHLHTVRSVGHINTSKSYLHNNSQERVNSITRKASIPYNPANIYTSHKQAFHPLGTKIGSTSSLIASNHPKSVTYVRQPNYYSVQKSSNRGEGVRLDIQDLKIKNQRNYSM